MAHEPVVLATRLRVHAAAETRNDDGPAAVVRPIPGHGGLFRYILSDRDLAWLNAHFRALWRSAGAGREREQALSDCNDQAPRRQTLPGARTEERLPVPEPGANLYLLL